MAKQELNLFQLSSRAMTKARTAPAQIVRRKIRDSSCLGTSFDYIPHGPRCESGFEPCASFQYSSEYNALVDSGIRQPTIDKMLAPVGDGHCAQPPSLSHKIGNHPVVLPSLQLTDLEANQFSATQPASN
jgi:hypothetical protein